MLEFFANAFLAATGWNVRNDVPAELDKFVIILAPHTSNLDFPFMLAVTTTMDMRLCWCGKHTMFRGPLNGLMRRLGGIPVDRRKCHDLVAQIAESFDTTDADAMALGLAPEATRAKRERWKSGFYHIAHQAGVPIVLGYLDYERKEAGIGPIVDASQPKAAVMDIIRDFYADKVGCHHDRFTEPTLPGERRHDETPGEKVVEKIPQ